MRWTQEAKVGFFTVFSVTLLVFAGWYVSRHKERESRDFQVVFSGIDGLQERANVYLAGVAVGFVKKIDFIDGRRVGVTISVLRSDAPMYRAHNPDQDPAGTYYVYTINGNSVGDRWVEILPGKVPPTAVPLEPGARVAGQRPLTLNELTQKGYQILSKLDESVEALSSMSSDPSQHGDLRQVMADFREVAKNLKAASSDAGFVVAGLSEKGERLSDSLETVITRVDQGVLGSSDPDYAGTEVLESLATRSPNDSTEVSALALNLKDTSSSIKKAIRAIELLSEGKGLDQGSIAAVKDLRNAAEEIQGIALDLRTTKHTSEVERDLRETSANSKLALASAARILGRADVYEMNSRVRFTETVPSTYEDSPDYSESTDKITLSREKPVTEQSQGLIERYIYNSKKRF